MYIMRNNEKTYKINLTHIATSYPESVSITPYQYSKITQLSGDTEKKDVLINGILMNKLGMDWAEQYFFDTISHIKI